MAPQTSDLALPLPGNLWRLTRLSLGYLLDQIHISRGGADIVDRLLLAAIIDANLAPIKQDPALQFAYGALDAASPDELRRPVRVNAVAESLGLPFETVRRRIARLTREGACVTTAGGVLVPQAALASPQFKAMSLARFERLKQFYFDLAAADALPDIPAAAVTGPRPAWFDDEPPVRVVNRMLAEHLLRFIEGVMRRVPDPLTGLFLLEAARANTEHLTLAEAEAEVPIPDSLHRPVSISVLAARLNVAPETLRRRAAVVERAGVCRRTRGGLIVLSTGIARPGVLSLIGENAANVQRLFIRLDRIGCLAAWSGGSAAGGA